MNNIVYAVMPFFLFGFICGVLTKERFSKKATRIAWAAVIAVVGIAHLAAGFSSLDNALLLSWMPLSAYLPVIAALFVLSKRNVVGNFFVVLFGLLAALIVELLEKLYQKWIMGADAGIGKDVLCVVLLAAVCVLLGFVVFRFFRGIFLRERVLDNGSWYILVALFFLIGLSLYQRDSLWNFSAILLILLADISVFFVIVGYINARCRSEKLKREREHIERQIAAERAEYKMTEQKLELGRRYRHDMRHHFAAIKGLIRQGNIEKIGEYVDSLGVGLNSLEQRIYCKNAVVNAVLSALLGRAEELGIAVETNLNIPEGTEIENSDICSVLSNVVENAVEACAAVAEGKRKLSVSADCGAQNRLMLSVVNSAAGKVELGGDGLPAVGRTEEHGYGLASVKCIVDRYDGLMQCESTEDSFSLRIVLFGGAKIRPKNRKKGRVPRALALVPVFLAAAILTLNVMPATVSALENVPLLGKAVRVIDFRNWGFGWGDSEISAEYPVTDDGEVNKTIEEYIEECRERFEWYFARKYEGYVAADIGSEILRRDGEMLIISMECTINAGSSAVYRRYFVIDNSTGEIVSLSDLFREDADYGEALSAEITAQIAERVAAGDFYFGYGIWETEPGFGEESLDDSSFYIDGAGRLVIVFNEGEIAPNATGTPTFVIPAEVTAGIAAEGGLLMETTP